MAKKRLWRTRSFRQNPDDWEAQYGLTGGPHDDLTYSGGDNLTAYALGLNPHALDGRLLPALSAQINPRRMSDILAQMSPEAAERLSSEIANRSGVIDRGPATSDLPKIEGRPNGT